MHLVLAYVCTISFWGDAHPLLDEDFFNTGQSDYSPVEVALLAEGLTTGEALEAYMQKYESLLVGMSLTAKQAGRSGKKRAKSLLKKLFGQLKSPGADFAGVRMLVDEGHYSDLSATLVFFDLAARHEIDLTDFAQAPEGLDPFFFSAAPATLVDVVAANLIAGALHETGDPQTSRTMLRISKALSPTSTYGTGTLDVRLYKQTYEHYQSESWETAALLASGAAARYPDLKEFQALCYNIGIRIFGVAGKGIEREPAMALGEMLAPFTGEFRNEFRGALATTAYNFAVDLYNRGSLEAALTALDQISDPPDPAANRQLALNCIERLLESFRDSNQPDRIEPLLVRMQGLDAERATRLRARLGQLELKAVAESGDLEQAMRLALQDLDSEIGRNNYLSVLSQFNHTLRREKRYEHALAVLDETPDRLERREALQNLRFNTYVAWIKHFPDEDYTHLIPLYRRILADSKLELSSQDKNVYRENYGLVLYREIETLIAERRFDEANNKSKQALRLLPDHAALKRQRTLVDQIMERIRQP